MYTKTEVQERRDRQVAKVMRHLRPLWLVNDEYRALEESCLFDLVYPHSEYNWVQSSYRYDAFNDVLYHMGERRLTEEEALLVQERDPYLAGEVAAAVPVQPRPRSSEGGV